MSFTFFISKRLNKNNKNGERVSKPIVLISVLIIALAAIINLLSISIVTGYQKEVKEKIMGFVSPIFISKLDSRQIDAKNENRKVNIFESEPIPYDSIIIQKAKSQKNVSKIDPVLYRPALLYSKKINRKISLQENKDSLISYHENKDVLCKGVHSSYDWSFLKNYITEGEIKNFKENEIILSENIADNLNFKLHDTISVGFITNEKQGLKQFYISALYKTGFQEYDKHMVFCKLSKVQENAGLKIQDLFEVDFSKLSEGLLHLNIRSNKNPDQILLKNNDGVFILEEPFVELNANTILILEKTTKLYNQYSEKTIYKVIVESNVNTPFSSEFIAELDSVKGNFSNNIEILSKKDLQKRVKIKIEPLKKPQLTFISGYEIGLKDLNSISQTQNDLQKELGFNASKKSEYLQVSTVYEAERDLFVWLNLLDLNVYVIIILMLIIGIVNAGSAIIVVIALKRNFIGILKALGANNWAIRKIFLYHAGTIILKGLLIGNFIGLVLIFLQDSFKLISLNPEIYYLNHVPVHYSWDLFIFMNIMSFVICILCLIIPTYLVSKIDPIKSIKFN